MCTHLSPGYFSRVWYLCVCCCFFFLWGGGVHVTISPGEKKAEETFLPWVPYYFMGGGGGGGGIPI